MKTIVSILLAAVMAVPFVGGAQSIAAADAAVPVEWAALKTTAGSSSSASEMFAGAGQSTITIGPAPVVNKPEVSRRALSSVGIGVKAGLGGVGFDVATPLVPGWLNLRGGASFFSYSGIGFTISNINVDGSLKFKNAEAVVDVFPFHGVFRLSGGMTTYNNTGLLANLSVPGGQSFKLGDTTYYSSMNDPIGGTAAFRFGGKTAGRASIGTGNMLPRKGHFAFESELGVQFFTSPTVAYTITGTACQNANGTNCGSVAQFDVTAEQNKMQNKLVDLKYYPILSFGFSYKIH